MTVSPPLNPILMELSGNGSLAGRDRAGAFTATGSGALRYAPAPGARVNMVLNPRAANNITYWAPVSSATRARVVDAAFSGGTAFQVITPGSATDEGIAHQFEPTPSNTMRGPLGAAGYVTISFDILVNDAPSQTAFFARIFGYDLSAAFSAVQSAAFTVPSVGNVHRIVVPINVTNPLIYNADALYLSVSTGVVLATTFRVSNFVLETGNVPNATYFDGAQSGRVWLDPRTGQLGTAHASPSVSRAVFWVEEATTNLVGEPSAETTVSGYAPQGAGTTTVTRDTTRAYLGAASAKVVCDGTASIQGLNVGSSGLGLTMTARTFCGSIYLCGSGTVNVWTRLGYSDASVDNGTVTLVTLTSAWQRIVPAPITANPAKQLSSISIQVRTNSAQAVTFWADCVQAEEKAYATSYCDGSLGTGYTWAGTAHASNSTRAGCQITYTNTNRVFPYRGSEVARVQGATPQANMTRSLMQQGNFGTGEFSNFFFDNLNSRIGGYTKQGGGANRLIYNTPVVLRWDIAKSFYFSWDTDFNKVGYLSDATLAQVAREDVTSPSAALGVSTSLIGLATVNGLNGYVGPLAIYDQPLSDARRALVNAAIDSNGATDLWALFEEWEAIGQPADLLAPLQSGEATAGARATVTPATIPLTAQSLTGTSGASAEVEAAELVVAGQAAKAGAIRRLPDTVEWSKP